MPDLFTDNPLIATLGSALHLGDVFGDASAANSGASAAPTVNPNAVQKPGASKPNIPEYKNRPYIPQNENRGVGSGQQRGAMGLPPEVAQMDPATLQNPQVQALLQHFGVNAGNVQPNPNVFLQNPAAYQNHPVIANAIERGLEGFANYQPGVDTAGTISNVARSVLGANAMRAQAVNAQLQQPFNAASQVAALQNQQLQQQNVQSEIAGRQALGAHYAQSDANMQQYHQDLLDLKQQSIEASNQRAAGRQTPERIQYDTAIAAGKAKWAADNDADPEDAPPSVLAQISSDAAKQISTNKATGSNIGRNITANASITNTNTRAGVSRQNNIDNNANRPGGTNDTKFATAQLKVIQSKISKMDAHGKGTMFQDPKDGTYLAPGQPRWNAVYNDLKQQETNLTNQIKGGPNANIPARQPATTQTAPQTAPSSPAQNPFR